MTRPAAVEGALWSLLAAFLGLAVALVLAFPGVDLGGREEPLQPAAVAPPPPSRTRTPLAEPPPAPRSQQSRPVPAASRLVLAASGGACWVEARAGSPTGELLFLGLVEEGRTVRLRPGRVWLRLGASENVVLTVAGKRRPLPGGTVDLVV